MSEEEREALREVAALVLLLAEQELAKANAVGNWNAVKWLTNSKQHMCDAMQKAFYEKGK